MRITALEYHDVVSVGGFASSGYTGPAAASYKLELPNFEAHLHALAEGEQRTGVPIAEALDAPARDRRFVCLTFDDGGASASHMIAPALEHRGWIGHFFIATEMIGRRGFLDEAALRDLASRGHVVGSHSCTHPLRMASLTSEQLRDEWTLSVARLGEVLGEIPRVASVPGGAVSNRVVDAAAEAGIRILFTSEPTTALSVREGCTIVGRYTLRRHHSAAVAAALVNPRSFSRASQWAFWNAKKAAKWLGGDVYLRVRGAIMD